MGCNAQIFVPTFPAASPFVTAVGGTTGNPETGECYEVFLLGHGFASEGNPETGELHEILTRRVSGREVLILDE